MNERFLQCVESVFDEVYAQQLDKSTSRTACQLTDVVLLRQLIEEEVFIDDGLSEPDLDFRVGRSSVFANNVERSVAAFAREADNTLRRQHS